jgi:hypothetical protein
MQAASSGWVISAANRLPPGRRIHKKALITNQHFGDCGSLRSLAVDPVKSSLCDADNSRSQRY